MQLFLDPQLSLGFDHMPKVEGCPVFLSTCVYSLSVNQSMLTGLPPLLLRTGVKAKNVLGVWGTQILRLGRLKGRR